MKNRTNGAQDAARPVHEEQKYSRTHVIDSSADERDQNPCCGTSLRKGSRSDIVQIIVAAPKEAAENAERQPQRIVPHHISPMRARAFAG